MRLLAAIKNDIRFQIRYGFYFLYAFLTLLYSLVLIFVPEKYREIVSFIVIASDPAMVGFFFIGAIWLLEKSEGVQKFFVISPLKSLEYIISKAVSLAVISTISALVLLIVAGKDPVSYLLIVPGIFAGSGIFSIIGLLASTYAKTVNQYLIISVPAEMFITLPIALYAFKLKIPGLEIFPGTLLWKLISERISAETPLVLLGIIAWILVAVGIAIIRIPRALSEEGGVNI